ncbi:hypothetical protein BGX28_007470 [Mortierella sp. GBA30]|nr:hypothetical protein BGX28_007470 [Mortierella sp. GBA30]
MDEDHRTPGSSSVAAVSAEAAGAAAIAGKYGANKAQPSIPKPAHGYYQDDRYAYNQYPHQQSYNDGAYNNAEDEYYNPYYATGGPPGHDQGYGPSPASTLPPFYSGSGTPHQDSQPNRSGYFPPPPPINSNAHSASPVSDMMSPSLTSTTLTSSTLTSSHLRGPQAILETEPLQEMGTKRRAPQSIPMKELSSSSH